MNRQYIDKQILNLNHCVFPLLLLFFLSFTVVAFAGNAISKKDSLYYKLATSSDDKKADILTDFCWYYRSIDTDSLFVYAKRLLEFSQQIKYNKGIAYGNFFTGLAWHDTGNIEQAREYYYKALYFFEKAGDKKGIATVNNSIGNSHIDRNEYADALRIHLIALKLRIELKDRKGLSASYNNIGNIFAGLGNYQLSLPYYLEVLKINEEVSDTSTSGKYAMAMTYVNVGRIYTELYNFKKGKEYLDKAFAIYNSMNDRGGESMVNVSYGRICEKQGDLNGSIKYCENALNFYRTPTGVSPGATDNYIQLTTLHYQKALEEEKNNNPAQSEVHYKKMFAYADSALEMSISLNYKVGISSAYIIMGRYFRHEKKYDIAVKYFKKAIATINNRQILMDVNEGLYHVFAEQKKYQEALDYYVKYIQIKDSAYNVRDARKVDELGLEYEEERKDKMRKLEAQLLATEHAAQLKKRNTILWFSTGGLFLAVICIAVVYRSYRQKQKANTIIIKQKAQVEEALGVIANQKKIVEQHNKDITDSINYAKRIQTALLASDSLLKKNLQEFFILYKPKDIVSGDFYWASEVPATDKKYFALCTGDCTGHGVPGAFMSLLNITKLNESINQQHIVQPDLILNNVREEIIKALNPENATEVCNDGMDCTLCVFDFNDLPVNTVAKLHYAAANNAPYIIRNNQLVVGHADKIPVGKSTKEKELFTLHTIELQKGDIIYTFTDGYADQFGGQHGKKFKYKALETLLLTNCTKPMNEQKKILNDTIEEWKGSLEQIDDILLIGVRV